MATVHLSLQCRHFFWCYFNEGQQMELLLNLVNCTVANSLPCRNCSSELDKPVLVYTCIQVSAFIYYFYIPPLSLSALSNNSLLLSIFLYSIRKHWFILSDLEHAIRGKKWRRITFQLMVPVLKIRAIVKMRVQTHERSWVHNFNNTSEESCWIYNDLCT